MVRRHVCFMLIALAAMPAFGQGTDVEECIDAGTFCSESEAILVDESCGQRFYRFRGRIAWSPRVNTGSVTISVRTRAIGFRTSYPLYLEVYARDSNDPDGCYTYIGGNVLLVGQGVDQCGGAWESIGPVDLRAFGVPLGAMYHLQAVFFEQHTAPPRPALHTVGFSCIRLTSHPLGVSNIGWARAKSLYR